MAYRMTPARRRALRKAQVASARKRRGRGKLNAMAVAKGQSRNAKLIRRKKIAKVAVGAAVVGTVAYQAHYHLNYVTGYHRTSYDKARNIVENQNFVSKTQQRKVEGSANGIWFSKYKRGKFGIYKPLGATNQNFGPGIVKVKRIPRSVIQSHRKVMDGYAGKGSRSVGDWFMVNTKDLKGRKIKRSLNPTSKRYRRFKRRQLGFQMSVVAPHMAYVAKNWADPTPRKRRKR